MLHGQVLNDQINVSTSLLDSYRYINEIPNSFEALSSISYTTGQLNSSPLALHSVNDSSLNLGPPLRASLLRTSKEASQEEKKTKTAQVLTVDFQSSRNKKET